MGSNILHTLETIVQFLGEFTIHILEIVGVFMIFYGTISALYHFAKNGYDFRGERTKIILGSALSLALEFKLGAEIIKTVLVRSLDELIILAIIVALRLVLTYVIHWEVEKANLACEFKGPGEI